MTVKQANIFTGSPDQAVSGAVLTAPVGTILPTSTATALDAAFKDSGYISDAGVKLTPNRTTASIKDWDGNVVRRVLQEFSGDIAWVNLELNGQSLQTFSGDGNVTVTPATSTTGTLTATVLNATDPGEQAYAFKIKDGNRKVLLIVPQGTITKQDPIEFKKGSPISLGVTLSTTPDSAGNHIYLYTDDGVYTA